MSYIIVYQERALIEYEIAIEWYSERSERAALNFEKAVNRQIDSLRSDPVSYKKTYKQFREISLKKYPFSIVYLVNDKENKVVISSVFHHKRNPKEKFSVKKQDE